MNEREKEISLYDMLIYILQRWRALIIWLVVGAVVLGAYGWLKSGNSDEAEAQAVAITEFEAQVKADNEVNGAPLDKVKWENVLTPNQIEFVKEGVEYWNEFKIIQEMPENPVNPESKEVYISKWTYYTNEINARITLQNYFDRFSENQRKYFRFLTNDQIIQDDENAIIDTNTTQPVIKKTISLKYIALGAVLGLILAAVVILIKYIVTKTIKTVDDLEDGYGFQILGTFDSENEFDKKHKTKFDQKLRNARRKNKHKIGFDENVELTATKIQIAAEKLSLSNICLITDIEDNNDLMNKIVEKLNGKVNATVIKNVLAKADALQDMAKMDGAVLIEQVEESKDKDIQDECVLCSKYGINIIGSIVLE